MLYWPFGNSSAIAWSAKITGLQPSTPYSITFGDYLWLVEFDNRKATLTARSADGKTLDHATIPVKRGG